jgi:hypothetical protein
LKRRHSLFVGLTLIAATCGLSLPGHSDPPVRAILSPAAIVPARAHKASVVRKVGRLPLSFERNQGQTDSHVRFFTHSGDSTLFLTPSEAVFAMPGQANILSRKKSALQRDRKPQRAAGKRLALRMQWVGANPRATMLTQQPLPGRINYFSGKDPSRWHTDVPTFGRVGFHQVYPGIDLVYYGNQRHLEYDFVVAPHADPRQIHLHFAGAKGVRVNAEGDLIVRAEGRELKWRKPAVYQQDAAGKHSVAARFRLKRLPNGQKGVSFALGHYDSARPLIIDPVLLYSTYLGGSAGAGEEGDTARHIAIDGSGNAYIAGYAFSTDFPTTSGAFQPAKNADTTHPSAFVTKINATGTALVYSTYLGGSDSFGSYGNGIAVDSSGNAYITGDTNSTDFPTTPGAFQRALRTPGTHFGNAFVTKLNATGSALLYSTYLGGSGVSAGYGDEAKGIAIDGSGNAYVTGDAASADFPTTPGAFQGVNNAKGTQINNAFVTKLNSTGTALVYSTYVGGSGYDFAYGIAIDGSGNAYITGFTGSADFPTTSGAFQRVFKAATYTAFVTKLNATGTALVYSTFLGGGSSEYAASIAVDSSGNAYIAGSTASLDFPTTPGAYQRVNRGGIGDPTEANTNAFVTKLNSTGTALVYSTYLGGTPLGDGATGIAIDANGNAYVVGQTFSSDFPTTLGAFQRVNRSDTGNLFVAKLNPAGTALLYSTYLGGSFESDGVDFVWGDGATGLAIDRSGNAYVLGVVYSTDFPTTPGAFQPTNHAAAGSTNGTVTKLSTIPVFPDFNNDGSPDLLLQNTTTGQIGSWFQQGARQVGGALFSLTPPSDFALVGVGDFRANGSNTLVLQSPTTRQIAMWYTSGANNATIPGGVFIDATPEPGWKVVGVGDFNGDGKSDLVFQNQSTGRIVVWFMNGASYQGGVVFSSNPGVGWQIVGAGDFNKDGFTDLVFQNQTTGQIALWYLNGTTYIGGTVLRSVPATGWKVVGVGDYNGDGSADLLLQNQTSNQAAVWYLQNGVFAGSDALSLPPPSGWKIVGPR